jgi:hypothetical protein
MPDYRPASLSTQGGGGGGGGGGGAGGGGTGGGGNGGGGKGGGAKAEGLQTDEAANGRINGEHTGTPRRQTDGREAAFIRK